MEFTPIWKQKNVKDEILVFVEGEGEITANLAFNEPKNVQITDRKGNLLIPDKDYQIRGNKVVLLNKNYFFFQNEWLFGENMPKDIPTENAAYHIEGCMLVSPFWLYERQFLASYESEGIDFPDIFPERLQLERTNALLANKKQLKIALFGDSISNCANSSWSMKFGGRHWIEPAIERIEKSYGANVELLNISRSGYGTAWAIEEGVKQLENAGVDLTVIAFGMNDGYMPVESFVSNAQELIHLARKYNPEMEFILISTPIPNPACKQVYGSQIEHFKGLCALEEKGVTVLNMTLPFTSLNAKKRYVEISGNNLNHPNDYGYRYYTDAFTELFRRLQRKSENRMAWQEYFNPPKWEETHFSALPKNIRAGYLCTEVNGNAKKTFAFLAMPENIRKKCPAVLLVHGAGGNAYYEWAQAYAEQGYIALSIDIDCTHFTDDDLTKKKANPFVGARELGGFNHVGKDPKDSWIYYSVAQLISAHSLLLSLKETDVDKTALVGISWGGVASLITLGIDKRFAAASIIYSSGFITEDTLGQERGIFNEEKNKEFYDTYFDPRNYVAGIDIPVLFNAGLNDAAFSPFNRKRTYALFDKTPSLAIIPDLYHDNESNFRNKNVSAFLADCLNGTNLRKPLFAEKENGEFVLQTSADILRAELLSTDGVGNPHTLEWTSEPLSFEKGKARVKIPKARYYMAVVYYGDGLYTSTDIFEN